MLLGSLVIYFFKIYLFTFYISLINSVKICPTCEQSWNISFWVLFTFSISQACRPAHLAQTFRADMRRANQNSGLRRRRFRVTSLSFFMGSGEFHATPLREEFLESDLSKLKCFARFII